MKKALSPQQLLAENKALNVILDKRDARLEELTCGLVAIERWLVTNKIPAARALVGNLLRGEQ